MKLTDHRYLSSCAALAVLAIAWGGIAAVIERTVPVGTPVVVTRNGVNETIAVVTTQPVDIRLTPEPPPPPPPPPDVATSIKVPSRTDIPISGKLPMLLERGGTYSFAVLTPNSGTTYGTYGDPAKPLPILNGRVEFNAKTDITFDGLRFRGSGKAGSTGVNVLRSSRIVFKNGEVSGYGANGVNVQGYGGIRCNNVQLRGMLIANNSPADASKHCEGFYVQETDAFLLDGSVVAENGAAPGTGTQFNQGGYIHATCGPATVTNSVFYKNAAHGLQMRSGGICRGNLFLDNPVGMSFGLVNGEAAFAGGVSGDISDNVFIGGGAVAGGPNAGKRGWAMDLSNAKSVVVQRDVIAHDNQNFSPAIHIANCQQLTNPAQALPANKWSLSLRDVWVYDWKPGPMELSATYTVNGKAVKAAPTMVNMGNVPPKMPNLRDVLGAGFMPWARDNPTLAAPAAVSKIKAAVGVN